VPAGKRLVIEHATASAVNNNFRSYREPAAINIFTEVDGFRHMSHLLVFSENGFPVAGVGPITYYLDPGDGVSSPGRYFCATSACFSRIG
jgi:hypothetical protein